ncbi:MAG: BLUF domain-containing protein [Pseudomonadota bacterium]
MHMLCYMSDAVGAPDEIESTMSNIIQTSRKNNHEKLISGVLIYHKGKYLQVIEGPKENIQNLYHVIEQDNRHENCKILIDCEVESRGFAEWKMEDLILDQGKVFNFEDMKRITDSFQKNLIPRSDMLMFYYKTLLNQPTKK